MLLFVKLYTFIFSCLIIRGYVNQVQYTSQNVNVPGQVVNIPGQIVNMPEQTLNIPKTNMNNVNEQSNMPVTNINEQNVNYQQVPNVGNVQGLPLNSQNYYVISSSDQKKMVYEYNNLGNQPNQAPYYGNVVYNVADPAQNTYNYVLQNSVNGQVDPNMKQNVYVQNPNIQPVYYVQTPDNQNKAEKVVKFTVTDSSGNQVYHSAPIQTNTNIISNQNNPNVIYDQNQQNYYQSNQAQNQPIYNYQAKAIPDVYTSPVEKMQQSTKVEETIINKNPIKEDNSKQKNSSHNDSTDNTLNEENDDNIKTVEEIVSDEEEIKNYINNTDTVESNQNTESITEQWEKTMKNFMPQMILTFKLAGGEVKQFHHYSDKLNTLFRGGFFEANDPSQESSSFKVISPSGKIVFQTFKSDGLFKILTTEIGEYSFVISSSSWSGSKFVTFVIGEGIEKKISPEDLNTIKGNLNQLARSLNNIETHSSLYWKRKKMQSEKIKVTSRKTFYVFLTELVLTGLAVATQFFFVKKMLSKRSLY